MTARPEPYTTKAGRTTYKVRFRYRGKQTSETFDTKREASRFAVWLDRLGPQGALEQLHELEVQRTTPTLNEVAADHIQHLTGITAGTRLSYVRLWNRTWAKHLGTVPANRVTKDDVSRAVNVLGQTYSHKSLENQRGLLAAVLGRAVEQGYLTKNPAKGIRLPRTGETERVEMVVLTGADFLGIIDRLPEHWRPLVWFLGGTGCRWGEAVALQVGDVRLPNVHIRRALNWSPDNNRTVGPTKTRRSNRTVTLPNEVIELMPALLAGKAKTDLVFTAPKGGPVLHRTFWSRVWLPAVRHLEPRPRIHDLRHSHASWLLAAGEPANVVQARLGHESIKTTVDTYGKLMPDAQQRAAHAASLVFRANPELTS